MKVIIAGTRTFKNYELVKQAIERSGFNITEVVWGTCEGVDNLGKQWAIENNIPYTPFYPDWGKYGKAAGPIRNRQMAEYGEALIVIWDGKSTGTKNMIEEAKNKGLFIKAYKYGNK